MSHVVDVNTATAEELDAVPGLQGHGFEIVRYRGERGRFTDLRQLDEVPGGRCQPRRARRGRGMIRTVGHGGATAG